MDKQRLDNLLEEHRMYFFKHDQGGTNRLFGLHDLILENITDQSIGCEIGSFAGISSELFALYCKTIYCVDSWVDYQGEAPAKYLEEAEAKFDAMLERNANVHKIKASSSDAIKKFKDNFFDFVYIDANHTYEAVKNDIKIWLPKIKKGGFISGHDYTLIPSVKQAVNQFFAEETIKVYSDSSWLVKII